MNHTLTINAYLGGYSACPLKAGKLVVKAEEEEHSRIGVRYAFARGIYYSRRACSQKNHEVLKAGCATGEGY